MAENLFTMLFLIKMNQTLINFGWQVFSFRNPLNLDLRESLIDSIQIFNRFYTELHLTQFISIFLPTFLNVSLCSDASTA